MIILGIDPGLGGALCFLNPETSFLTVLDMPTLVKATNGKNRRSLDHYELARLVDSHAKIDCAYVERVGAMPHDGSVQAFAFGKTYGAIIGVLAAYFIPIFEVSPVTWKRAMNIKAGADKDESRAAAKQNFPAHSESFVLRKHDGRAEASLIALWGAQQRQKVAA